jgi:hypothetical protein
MTDMTAATDAVNATSGLLSRGLTGILNSLSTAAGLGVAAMGLVDTSKAFSGGASNFGFGYIERALGPFLSAQGPFDKDKILTTLRANWLNGVAKAESESQSQGARSSRPDGERRAAARGGRRRRRGATDVAGATCRRRDKSHPGRTQRARPIRCRAQRGARCGV